MKKRILMPLMAVVMVVMGASPALARGGADVCVSIKGVTKVDMGESGCVSDATSRAVAVNGSFADASNGSHAVAVNHSLAGANLYSHAVVINNRDMLTNSIERRGLR